MVERLGKSPIVRSISISIASMTDFTLEFTPAGITSRGIAERFWTLPV